MLLTFVIAGVAMTGLGCSGEDAESCVGLQRELDALSATTQDAVQTWQKIEDLQIAVTRMEQIKATLASDFAHGS
ncbi:MAG: hypothetical protein RL238_2774 [Actinomycetota bacterium]|jgi:hypothetical protein